MLRSEPGQGKPYLPDSAYTKPCAVLELSVPVLAKLVSASFPSDQSPSSNAQTIPPGFRMADPCRNGWRDRDEPCAEGQKDPEETLQILSENLQIPFRLGGAMDHRNLGPGIFLQSKSTG